MNNMYVLTLGKVLIILSVLFSASLWALDIKDAKSTGLVGETEKGYIHAVSSSASADVKALIATINKQRKAKYEKIAKDNGIDLSSVEVRAGKVTIEKTSAGQYVQINGKWIKK